MQLKFLLNLLLAFPVSCGAQKVTVMTPDNNLKSELAQTIAGRNVDTAKALAHRMPPGDAGAVLQDMAANQRSSIRLLVLDIASEVPSEGASRAILSRLQDADLTVRAVANSLIGSCGQKSIVPDLFAAMDQNEDLLAKGAMARQIGTIGDSGDLPRLRERYNKARDPQLRDDLAAAMARLGDERSRNVVVRRLSDSEVDARVKALHDIEYIGDPRLARHFRPVLEDQREAIAISPPHDPRVSARVCDVAAGSLTALGVPLSFRALPLRRLSEPEIQEALQRVMSLENAQ